MTYKPQIVAAYYVACGLPKPEFEFRFHPTRKWRFDIAWPSTTNGLFIEVQGGIFIAGGHNRGAQMLKDFEKWNEATCLDWRGLWLQPKDLCTLETVKLIKRALGIESFDKPFRRPTEATPDR